MELWSRKDTERNPSTGRESKSGRAKNACLIVLRHQAGRNRLSWFDTHLGINSHMEFDDVDFWAGREKDAKCNLSAVGENLRSKDRLLAIFNTKGRVLRSVTSAMFYIANQDQRWLAKGKNLDRSCKSDVEESETIGEVWRWFMDSIRFRKMLCGGEFDTTTNFTWRIS